MTTPSPRRRRQSSGSRPPADHGLARALALPSRRRPGRRGVLAEASGAVDIAAGQLLLPSVGSRSSSSQTRRSAPRRSTSRRVARRGRGLAGAGRAAREPPCPVRTAGGSRPRAVEPAEAALAFAETLRRRSFRVVAPGRTRTSITVPAREAAVGMPGRVRRAETAWRAAARDGALTAAWATARAGVCEMTRSAVTGAGRVSAELHDGFR